MSTEPVKLCNIIREISKNSGALSYYKNSNKTFKEAQHNMLQRSYKYVFFNGSTRN